MTVPHRYVVIDTFATERDTGNPAAVVFDADSLNDADLQTIAGKLNQPITTFVLRPQASSDAADYRLRWFTPTTEIRMCGHGSIAAGFALLEIGAVRQNDPTTSTILSVETASGVLRLYVESMPGSPEAKIVWLDLPDPNWKRFDFDADACSAALGATAAIWDPEFPPVKTHDHDLLTFVHNVGVLNDLRPDRDRIFELSKSHHIRGLCVSTVRTITPSVHVQSRFFAPSIGCNEDIVTGSVHGPLAAYLVDRGVVSQQGDLSGLTCLQGVAGGRHGMLHALVQCQRDGTYAVRIGGRGIVSQSGTWA